MTDEQKTPKLPWQESLDKLGSQEIDLTDPNLDLEALETLLQRSRAQSGAGTMDVTKPASSQAKVSDELTEIEQRAIEAEAMLTAKLGEVGKTKVGEITIDLTDLTLEDLVTLEQAAQRTLSTPNLIKFLDRVVVGGAKNLKLTQLPNITRALIEQTRRMSNPGN